MQEVKSLHHSISAPPQRWLEHDWRHVFEDHLPIFKKYANPYEVETKLAHEHRGNFYGYLTAKGFDKHYHWYLLRLNDMHDPCEFTEEREIIYLLDPSAFEQLEAKQSLLYVNEEETNY